jgi:hypothetical protein
VVMLGQFGFFAAAIRLRDTSELSTGSRLGLPECISATAQTIATHARANPNGLCGTGRRGRRRPRLAVSRCRSSECPELNPENVWQFMRDKWLSNRILTSYDDLLDHCCNAWNKLTDQPWTIMSIRISDWPYRS